MGKSGIIFGKVVVFGKMVEFMQTGCIRAKVFVFGQNGFILAKWFYSEKSGCIRAKVVVFGKQWAFFGQKLFYSGKVVLFG